MTDIRALEIQIVNWRMRKGFITGWGNFAEKCMLIVTEISEAVEVHRNWERLTEREMRERVEEELADAIIRILDLTGSLDMDIGEAIVIKMAKNEKRPMKHGKRY